MSDQLNRRKSELLRGMIITNRNNYFYIGYPGRRSSIIPDCQVAALLNEGWIAFDLGRLVLNDRRWQATDSRRNAYRDCAALVEFIDTTLTSGRVHYRTKAGQLLRTLDEVVNAILAEDLRADSLAALPAPQTAQPEPVVTKPLEVAYA